MSKEEIKKTMSKDEIAGEAHFLIARIANIRDMMIGLTNSAFMYQEIEDETEINYWMDSHYRTVGGIVREVGNTLDELVPKLSDYIDELDYLN